VAIIMDGNRRWARGRGASELEGHAAGVEAIRGLLRHAVRRGIPVLTLYAFSRENWARTDDEVVGLFGLLEQAIRSETAELQAQGVQVRLLGRLDELPAATRASIESALAATADGGRLVLNIAFNYAGRTELVDAVRDIVRAGTPADAIDEATISTALYTAGLPDPGPRHPDRRRAAALELLIWQSAYAELLTTDTLWPDFGPATSTSPWPSTPAGPDASAAEPMLRDRARSAAILVPPLLLALWLGGWDPPRRGLAIASAAWRRSGS
jgi:undecaprenyl diphosphate synthase